MPVSEALELARRLRRETEGRPRLRRRQPRSAGAVRARRAGGVRRPAAPDRVEALAASAGASAALGDVLAAARLALSMRRLGTPHLRRLRAGTDPAVPVLHLPAFVGAPGLETTSAVAAARRGART